MTIKEFATKQSISTQAVYKKLKAAGIPVSSIKQGNSQKLTAEGIKLLESIFDKPEVDSVENLKVENQLLKQQIEELKADRDRWAEIAKTAQESLQKEQQATHQAQALQMATLQAIGQKRSLWARLTGKTKDEKQ